jgi:serpin B
MRKLILGFVFIALMVLTACQPVEEPEVKSPEETELPESPIEFNNSELAREVNPDIDEEQLRTLAQDNAAFALNFYEQIRTEDGNIIFSPFSLSLALSMTLAGGETSTEEAMLSALPLTLPEEAVYPAPTALLLAI